MKPIIVIPSYWAGPAGKPTDKLINIYDHPTPFDEEGTLERTLESLIEVEGDFDVCVIGTMTEEELRQQFQQMLKAKLQKFSSRLNLFLFSHDELDKFHRRLDSQGLSYQKKYLDLEGYSNIRNLCIIAPQVLGSEIAILIDDDEVIKDKQFVKKAVDFMGIDFEGQVVLGKTGFYIDSEGSHLHGGKVAWHDWFWRKHYLMDEVMKSMEEGPRLKKSPLALGGGMVIHKDLFTKVSFDPWITRGEDIDYLVNAKLLGVDFYMDNELCFVHLPPSKTKSRIMLCRQDYYRFFYQRQKIQSAFKNNTFERFSLEELDPYPGRLLRRTVYPKAVVTSLFLSLRGIFKEEDREQYKNLGVCLWDALRYARKNKKNYFRFQKGWPSFMKHIGAEFKDLITKINPAV